MQILSCDIPEVCTTILTVPKCTDYYTEEEIKFYNCSSWYDGCNTCTVNYGKIDICTAAYCVI